MSADTGHWLDSLAVRITRRGALKAGMVAAVMTALPGLRPATARGDVTTDPCFEGCRAFEHEEFGRATQSCQSLRGEIGFNLLPLLFVPGIGVAATALIDIIYDRVGYDQCIDSAITNAKVAAFDCYGPNCSNFDPKQPNGPCDTCSENCCACPGIPNGFICCFYVCGDPDHNCCGS